MDAPAPAAAKAAASAVGTAPSPWGARTSSSPPKSPPRRSGGGGKSPGLVLSLDDLIQRGGEALLPVAREAAERAGGVRVEVTSPRALEACRRLGINPGKDLVLLPSPVAASSLSPARSKTPAAAAAAALPPEAEAKVFEHRRQRLLEQCKMIRRERQAILRQEQEAQLEWGAAGAGTAAGWAPWSSDPSWRGHSGSPSPGPGPASPVPAALRAPPTSPALGSPARVCVCVCIFAGCMYRSG